MASLNTPAVHPTVPAGVTLQDVVAIVSIHNGRASHANRTSPYAQTQTAAGANIFLHHIEGQIGYSIGRAMASAAANQETLDVYVPGSRVAKRQFDLVPDWKCDCWRLQSSSETLATVNDAPLQMSTLRTKQRGNQFPAVTYLKQSDVNIITVHGLQIDIWLLKSVRQVYGPDDFVLEEFDNSLQDVAHREDAWARNRFILTNEQVSGKSFLVINRFTGEKVTTKLFRNGNNPQGLRDAEFLAFAKQNVDASIARYLQTTSIDNIPAIITDSHAGFNSYGSLRDKIHESHPGVRFSIASKLARRLFPALAWMHFQGIIHGDVSNNSVLIKSKDRTTEHVLLVDYTNARLTNPGTQVSVADMLADGQAAMKLIEDCCDLWAFRNGPTPKAQGEWLMQKRTMDAMQQYKAIQRCSADFFERHGNSHDSIKGMKLNRLQNKLGNAWKSAEAAQKQNLLEREVALLSQAKVKQHIEEWESANPPQNTIHKQYMLLTLGHPTLDSLVDGLHVKQWNTMPHEVCASIKRAGGDIEEPWQTFDVRRMTAISEVVAWLATCCEVYPEWRHVLETEAGTYLQLNTGKISRAEFEMLHNALQTLGPLPVSMETMFGRIADMPPVPAQVDETYQIWYHVPSRMFNVTQLHRLATPEHLAAVITEGRISCENFVEVRGDPAIEGCYAPLSLLTEFADQLRLQVIQPPNPVPGMPAFDTADFSQVPPTRIVLARPGLIGYGSMLRTADQANFLYSRMNHDFITPSAFIPTYFGNMEVLPHLQGGYRTFDRPEHWSKYITAKESARSADLSKRRFQDVGKKSLRSAGLSTGHSTSIEAEESVLGQMLQQRESTRAAARPPAKRTVTEDALPSPKRARPQVPSSPVHSPASQDISMSFVRRMEERYQHPTKQAQPEPQNTSFMNNSFMQRNSALLTAAPNDPTNVNTSFTVGDDTEGLDEDWKAVNKMLAQMPDDDEQVQGITGFQYHGSDEDEDEATEIDPQSFMRRQADQSLPGSQTVSGSFQNPLSPIEEGSQAPTESFGSSRATWDGKGKGKAPAHNAPLASFEKHARFTSEATGSFEDLPPTEPSSPMAHAQAGTQDVHSLGSIGVGESFQSNLQRTPTKEGSFAIRNGLFNSPGGAITKFMRDQSGGQGGDVDEEDLPDTDSDGSKGSQ